MCTNVCWATLGRSFEQATSGIRLAHFSFTTWFLGTSTFFPFKRRTLQGRSGHHLSEAAFSTRFGASNLLGEFRFGLAHRQPFRKGLGLQQVFYTNDASGRRSSGNTGVFTSAFLFFDFRARPPKVEDRAQAQASFRLNSSTAQGALAASSRDHHRRATQCRPRTGRGTTH